MHTKDYDAEHTAAKVELRWGMTLGGLVEFQGRDTFDDENPPKCPHSSHGEESPSALPLAAGTHIQPELPKDLNPIYRAILEKSLRPVGVKRAWICPQGHEFTITETAQKTSASWEE